MAADWEKVPEPVGVLFGADPCWSPGREAQRLDRSCRTCGAAIPPGSRLYCAACTRTGFERKLARLKARSRPLAASAGKSKGYEQFKKLTRRDIRAIARTAEGRDWLRRNGWAEPPAT